MQSGSAAAAAAGDGVAVDASAAAAAGAGAAAAAAADGDGGDAAAVDLTAPMPGGITVEDSVQGRARADAVPGFSVGIDLGTTYSCVGVWQNDNVEIISNENGHRTTPSYVAFSGSDRLVGDAAKAQAAINAQNTVFDAKRLIGRKYSDASVKKDKVHWPFKIVRGPGDKPLIRVEVRCCLGCWRHGCVRGPIRPLSLFVLSPSSSPSWSVAAVFCCCLELLSCVAALRPAADFVRPIPTSPPPPPPTFAFRARRVCCAAAAAAAAAAAGCCCFCCDECRCSPPGWVARCARSRARRRRSRQRRFPPWCWTR